MQKNYLIGISGGSGAGKTTIVKSLVDHYQNKAAVLELIHTIKILVI